MELQFFTDSSLMEWQMLGLAFVLSAIIGIERQVHQKDAGLRTHVLVGLGSATFTLVSGLGFQGSLGELVILDPSRIAAQVVSGIGFLGAGVIFMRRDVVRGLTTAASIWVAAAVGMACGAGMPTTAIVVTVLHVIALMLFTPVVRRLAPARRSAKELEIRLEDIEGGLSEVMELAAEKGYQLELKSTTTELTDGRRVMTARFRLEHGPKVWKLAEELAKRPEISSIQMSEKPG
ncbi:MAG TPA: MgtC/SapB family protein [Actinomycetales bacterium]|nr:MgtC/SapB family protein [Actinomycetales bacterium]